MPNIRTDLLSLTNDDLFALTNRGNVKRAIRELDAGKLTCEFEVEDTGQLTAQWSDGIVCVFPPDSTLKETICSSGVEGISRYVIRSVLAYQRHVANETVASKTSAESPPDDTGMNLVDTKGQDSTDIARQSEADASDSQAYAALPWDPGQITDEQLVAAWGKRVVDRARKRYEQGVLVELLRSSKPTARFLDEPCVVRMLVQGHPKYVLADCPENLLGIMVCMTVWSFRQLDPHQESGIISIGHVDAPVPGDCLDAVESLIHELSVEGIANLHDSWASRVRRLEKQCETHGLTWPADLLSELRHAFDRYRNHDALFPAEQLSDFTGELLIRLDAIRNPTGKVHQQLVRGTRGDRLTDMAASHLIGLGCDVQVREGKTTLTAYLQDVKGRGIVGLRRVFNDVDKESDEPPKSFERLAAIPIARGVTFQAASTSSLLMQSGRRTSSCLLKLPRTAGALSTNPQNFTWEKLWPPAAVELFSEIVARLRILPPASLRPRRVGESIFVCSIKSTEDVQYIHARGCVVATLHDQAGGVAQLQFAYSSRGHTGFEQLLGTLRSPEYSLRFLSCHATMRHSRLILSPLCAIFEPNREDRLESKLQRFAVLPWIGGSIDLAQDAKPGGDYPEIKASDSLDPSPSQPDDESSLLFESSESGEALHGFLVQLHHELCETLLLGLRSVDQNRISAWSCLTQLAGEIGLIEIANQVHRFTAILKKKQSHHDWNPDEAVPHLLKLCIAMKLANDLA